jgi:hypothetical protein
MIYNDFSEEDKRRIRTKANLTLEWLRRGDWNTLQLIERVGPRPAAYVEQLRNKGYIIDSWIDNTGTSAYSLKGYDERIEVTEAMQSRYYKTSHWSRTRFSRMQHDGFQCCHCRSTDDLQVHHWAYDLFCEDVEDLVTLCRVCHERIHKYPNVKVHFPRWVIPDIAARLVV